MFRIAKERISMSLRKRLNYSLKVENIVMLAPLPKYQRNHK